MYKDHYLFSQYRVSDLEFPVQILLLTSLEDVNYCKITNSMREETHEYRGVGNLFYAKVWK